MNLTQLERNLLLIFIKNPEPGKVKTRLAKTIGNDEALKVYLNLLNYTLKITQHIQVDKHLFYDQEVPEKDMWPDNLYSKYCQFGADLGERMQDAFEKGFSKGYSSIVIIGSDCPELRPEIIEKAFLLLRSCDIVIGPARDGGYYLLGMKKVYASVFINKTWSSPSVFKETIDEISRLNLNLKLLPILSDVDNENDLHLLKDISISDI